jgi:hypothetical protein
MKRSLALALSLLIVSSAGMVWADAPGAATHVRKVKHHKKGGKGKPKNTLNPQPLPPKVLPPDQSGSKPQ